MPRRDQRQQREDDGVRAIEQRQRQPRPQRFHARDQERRHQRGNEAGTDEQQRSRQRAPRLVEDEYRKRDVAEPVAELVDRVAAREDLEAGYAKRRKRS